MKFIEFYNAWNSLILDKTQYIDETYCDNFSLTSMLLYLFLLPFILGITMLFASDKVARKMGIFLTSFLLLTAYICYEVFKNPECRFDEKIYHEEYRIYPADYTVDDFKEDMDKIGSAASPEQLQLAKKVMKICLNEKTKDNISYSNAIPTKMISCIVSNKKLFIVVNNKIYKDKQEKQVQRELEKLDKLK